MEREFSSETMRSVGDFAVDIFDGFVDAGQHVGMAIAHRASLNGWLGPEMQRYSLGVDTTARLIMMGVTTYAEHYPGSAARIAGDVVMDRPGYFIGRAAYSLVASATPARQFLGMPLSGAAMYGSIIDGSQGTYNFVLDYWDRLQCVAPPPQ